MSTGRIPATNASMPIDKPRDEGKKNFSGSKRNDSRIPKRNIGVTKARRSHFRRGYSHPVTMEARRSKPRRILTRQAPRPILRDRVRREKIVFDCRQTSTRDEKRRLGCNFIVPNLTRGPARRRQIAKFRVELDVTYRNRAIPIAFPLFLALARARSRRPSRQ